MRFHPTSIDVTDAACDFTTKNFSEPPALATEEYRPPIPCPQEANRSAGSGDEEAFVRVEKLPSM